ncbi:MAG: hypothetical protein M9922_04215 [Microthrixaceae bacterium]|nr:hypothetical protein [Microthrixaceae bacterium]
MNLRGPLPTGCTSPDDDGPVTCARASLAVGSAATFDIPVEAVFDCDVWGDSANNTLNGTTGGEIICGGGGGDTIQGRGGNDTVLGYGPRSDGLGVLAVGTGAAVTYGPGDLSGASTSDAVVAIAGTDGADNITTATGKDRIDGEEGSDVIVAEKSRIDRRRRRCCRRDPDRLRRRQCGCRTRRRCRVRRLRTRRCPRRQRVGLGERRCWR